MGCIESLDAERPLDDMRRGKSSSRGKANRKSKQPTSPKNGTSPKHAKNKGGSKSRASSAFSVDRRKSSTHTTCPVTPLTAPPARRPSACDAIGTAESAKRNEVATWEIRQRGAIAFDFDRKPEPTVTSTVVPGTTFAVELAIDDDEGFDRPRRSTMNAHEYDAAAKVRTMSTVRTVSVVPRTSISNPLSAVAVRTHSSEDDCWVIIRGEIYDVTALMDIHPGGTYAIFQHGGTDCTRAFEDAHPEKPWEALQAYRVGKVTGDT
jgi:hypothetical protein